jgi:small subunit ribosomal protein S3
MGQKTHPVGFRLGILKPWRSRWFATKGYAEALHEDITIRRFIKERMYHAGVSNIEVERKADQIRVLIHTARPGIIIGKKGSEVEKLKTALAGITRKPVQLDIVEVRKAELDAQLIAEQVASQLERRVAFRRAMKKTVQSTMRMGAQGVQIACAGRLAGAEIARREWYREGRMPLNTLRADIDYGFAEAKTTYGVIGVKCWVFHGEVLPEALMAKQEREAGLLLERPRRPRGPVSARG